MSNVEDRIKDYSSKNPNKCFALVGWKRLNVKNYSLSDILKCIYDAANGSFNEMSNIIDHLTSKKKVFGRTQVYAPGEQRSIDIIRDENGALKLVGYNPDEQLPLKGQHVPHNNKIFRKSDDQVSKTFKNAEEKMYNLGEKVRELFPNEDNHFITFAMQAIRKYAAEKKINPDKVISGFNKGRYKLDTDIWRVLPKRKDESREEKGEWLTDKKGNVKMTDDGKKVPMYCPECGGKMKVSIQGEPIYTCEKGHYFGTVKFTESKKGKTIIINEEDMSRLSDDMKMTPFKFNSNMRRFISSLLEDPVNTRPTYLLKLYGLNRSTLLKELITSGIIHRNEKISDTDENGQPKTATMMVKYSCPKKGFDRKLEKLYMKLFEKNLPQRNHSFNEGELNEEGEGGATSASASGQFVQPVGVIQLGKMPVEIEETTDTMSVGNYQYIVPFGGDEETLARKNGKNGSVSINEV